MYLIYCAENEVNGKKYIGKTTKNVEKRAKEHFGDALRDKTNRRFYNSLKKYGLENFKWYVIDSTAEDQEELNALEQHYICHYKTYENEFGYNKTFGGLGTQLFGKENGMFGVRLLGNKNGMWGKTHSKETRKILSEINKGIARTLGFKHSEETKKILSDMHKGIPLSEEHRHKLSEAHKRRPREVESLLQSRPGSKNGAARPIKVILPSGIIEYFSHMKACTYIPYHQIKLCVAGKRSEFKGYFIKYLTKDENVDIIRFVDKQEIYKGEINE